MSQVVVLGVNGQDGSFLAEKLVSRGYNVIGADRHEHQARHIQNPDFCYRQLDLRNAKMLYGLLLDTRPAAIFHFAGVHGSAGTCYESIWQDMLAVNTGSVQVILEYMRIESPSTKFIYAGSGKVFGPVYPKRISERSKMRASCLYTITKMGAHDLIAYYRACHGIKGSTIFFFNHESERRPKSFFIPTIVDILEHSLHDPAYKGSVATLDFDCDWGSAEEYMDIVVDISEKVTGEDLIVGTGKTWNARDFVDTLFRSYGLTYGNHILPERKRLEPSPSKASFRVIIEKLENAICRVPRCNILEVCDTILKRNYAVTSNPKKGNL
jgi:GDPmannose 4,6-dehydratase